MTIHSIAHGFETGLQALKILLGNSRTRTIFFVGLFLLSILFSFPAIRIIGNLFSESLRFSVPGLVASAPLIILSGLALIFFLLFFSILTALSVLKPQLTYGELFAQSASTLISGLGYAIARTIGMGLASPFIAISFGLLGPVINFFLDYVFSFYFVQLIDQQTLFIDFEKYKKTISHNLADYFGLWLFRILFIIFALLLFTIVVGGIVATFFGFNFSFLELIRHPLAIDIIIFSALLLMFSIFMVRLVGVCLLYLQEKNEALDNNNYRREM